MVGLYSIYLMLLLGVFFTLALLWNQRLAIFVFGLGVGGFVFLAVTIYGNRPEIYQATGINIYIVMFLTMMLLFAGGVGLFVKGCRRFITWLQKRQTFSTIS